MTVVGWTDIFNDDCKTVKYTKDHYKALVRVVSKRKYYFSYQMLAYNPESTPVFDDGEYTKVELTKAQWDEVLDAAYKDTGVECRNTPADILNLRAHNILWESAYYLEEAQVKLNG